MTYSPIVCITSITSPCPSSPPLIYIAFNDPTFAGSVEVNLEPISSKGCPDIEYAGWKSPDNYSLNKVLADFQSRLWFPVGINY
jgi:hypothetical protein